jgi:beta-N-acetylhexosaminidase
VTIEELARGVIATGFENDHVTELPRFGGYLLFARNGTSVERARAISDTLRARDGTQIPPLIAVDQEGGRVIRVRDGVEPMPSMMALGATGDAELAGRAGEQVAFDLRRSGYNFNFAPVLDLALDPTNTVIGTRSLGSDPGEVARLGEAFARGLERGGVDSCYKHFPGHGSTGSDSHVDLPVVDADEATLRRRDFAPFAAVAKTARAIMGAHVVVRALDADRPATLSGLIAGRLLRDEMGFDGAFLTDCLEMGAVAKDGTVDSAVAAIAAGADLLLVSHNVDLAIAAARAIERAVRDGAIPVERLRAAFDRVVRLRAAASAPRAIDEFPPHPGIGREIARRAITLVRGVPHADPTASFVVSFTDSSDEALRREAPVLEELAVAIDPRAGEEDHAMEMLDRSGRRPIVLARRAHLYPAQVRGIAKIVARYPDAVVVSMLEPFDLPLFSNARHVLASYGDDPASIGGLADVLFSGMMPQGRLPVDIAVAVANG